MKLLETVNTTPQTVVSLGNLNLGNVKHRICYGAFNYNGTDTITVREQGWYLINVKADLTSTVDNQAMVIGLYGNGTLIPETETNLFEAVAGSQGNVSFNKIIRICNGSPVDLTLRNGSSVSTIYDDVIFDIVKIG